MDPKTFIPAARAGFDLIQRVAPLAALGGPGAAGLANIVAGLTEMAEAALDNAERGTIAITTTDKAELREMMVQLRALAKSNDAAVRAS